MEQAHHCHPLEIEKIKEKFQDFKGMTQGFNSLSSNINMHILWIFLMTTTNIYDKF